MQVGFVGLGNMGWPMASQLVAAGHSVKVFDADTKVATRFAQEVGGEHGNGLSELARDSEVVITMLPNGHIVQQVALEAKDHLFGAFRRGCVLLDMSSSAPTGTQNLAREAAKRKIGVVDAPVSGNVARAKTGQLTIMVGGEAWAIKRCRPLLNAMGSQITLTGGIGSAHAMKALNNLLSAIGLLASAEVMLTGKKFGLAPQTMLDILNTSTGSNNTTRNKMRPFVLSGSFDSGFSLTLMLKDLGAALELAKDVGMPTPLGSLCQEICAIAATQIGEADHTEVVRWYEQLANAELRTDGVRA